LPASISVLGALTLLSCTSLPRHPRPTDFEGVGREFSGELVEAHLEALWGLGERSPGSESDEIARAYLEREFRSSGAKPDSLDREGERQHLIADLPGRSSDVVLLVAAYPVLGSRGGVDDTGAAVLVELARVLGSRKNPYTLRFALAETRPSTVYSRDALLVEAGRDLARALEAEGRAERIRAILVLDLSFHPNPVIARDLRSHPGFRALFWDRAAELGLGAMFPADADWASPETLQLGFRERGMDRIVALVEVAPAVVGTRGPRLSASMRFSGREPTVRALASLGQVMVDGLERLMERLQKVDAFAR